MKLQENVSLKGKTTMRIGGEARYFAEIETKEDLEQAVAFAKENNIPFIPLGGGSNTIFADNQINALIIRIKADDVSFQTIKVEAGKNLPALINELAKEGLDLSPLTGILGTVGGAVFGNAGQGPKGIWIDSYIESIEVYENETWKTYTKKECEFAYRESRFKTQVSGLKSPSVIWSTTLNIPKKDPKQIEQEIQKLLKQRIETQPHIKTAGSCFKAVGDTPAWQLIDKANLRNTKVGAVHISEKHANFLINDGTATFNDAVDVVKIIKKGIPEGLEVEMRFIQDDGTLKF